MKKMRRTRMNKRGISTILITVILIAVIAIASVGVVGYYYFGKSASEPEKKVSSLQFTTESMPDVSGTTTGAMTGYLKNIDTDNLKLRMEVTLEGEVFMMLIANGEMKKAWIWSIFSNAWMDIPDYFENQWFNAEVMVDEILLGLSKGTLEEFNYTDPTTNETQTFKIANYQVNPTIADSLFEVDTTDVAEQGNASIVISGEYADRIDEIGNPHLIVYGNAENVGNKDALNCRLEIYVTFDFDYRQQSKTEIVNLGDIPVGSSKEFNATIQLPIGADPAMSGYRVDVFWD